MSTSANVTYYQVSDIKGNRIREHRQNCLCKNSVRGELATYQPPEDYTIVLRWPDEDEANHYTEGMSLKDYLDGKKVVWRDDY